MDIGREAIRQARILADGCVEVIPEDGLAARIESALRGGSGLRVKLGIDPTTPHVHIGHAVPYRLIRRFQDLGHTAVLIIGDYTARIGDPTDRNRERPALSEAEVNENARAYTDQILKIVREDRLEIRRQSEWFSGFTLGDFIRTSACFSLAHMLTHETFRSRLDSGNRLSLHELLYPVLQAYDSVAVEADVELGATDQTFNCLCGRDLMRSVGMEPQMVMTVPLLRGLDGRKMSKSLGNHVSLLDSPEDMYGKIMSIPDSFMPEYWRLAAGMPAHDAEPSSLHPMEAKRRLSRTICAAYHGGEAAAKAAEDFDRVFSKRGIPGEIAEYRIADGGEEICGVLVSSGNAVSLSEARRLVLQGGVRLDGEVIRDPAFTVGPSAHGNDRVIKIGKRRFLKVAGTG